jgi:methylase of polypeptide subunit release factors
VSQNSTNFNIDDSTSLNLCIREGVFQPTATTSFLIDSVAEHINTPGKLLDLGSGTGVVGISLFLKNLVQAPLFASDFSKTAIECILKNCQNYDVAVEAKFGSLFDPWENEIFDYIVDDISGVAEEVAKISPWFKNIPCDSGIDGTNLTIEILKQASRFLSPGGVLFFPVISFSNTEKIIKVARQNFSNVDLMRREEWPLPKEMEKHLPILKRIQDEGHIQMKELFGMTLCFTEIYAAKN